MIHVDYREPDDPAWKKWRASSATAMEQLWQDYTKRKPIKISQARYKKMKALIFRAFHGKCAYCESLFTVDQPGDVEHFRPKGDVVDENDQPVIENGRPHPGYFWLAYDWQNLLPCCSQCNRLSRTEDGRLVGKGTRFPVVAGRAWTRDAVEQEEPVFLHPVLDDPEKELKFDPETGAIAGRTERAQVFVALLDLNRDSLVRARFKAYVDVQAEAVTAYGALALDENSRRGLVLLSFLEACQAGELPYSLAGRQALADIRAATERIRAVTR